MRWVQPRLWGVFLWGCCKPGNQKVVLGKSFPGLRSLEVKGLAPISWNSEGGGRKKMFLLVNQNSWSSASSGIAIDAMFPSMLAKWLLLIRLTSLVPCRHTTAPVTPCLGASSLAVTSQCLRAACWFSSAAQPPWAPCRGLRTLLLQSCTFSLHLERRTGRATGKGWLSWSQCSAAGRQDLSGRQAGNGPTLYAVYEGLDCISAGIFPDIISVLSKLRTVVEKILFPDHPFASEEQDKIFLQHLVFFHLRSAPGSAKVDISRGSQWWAETYQIWAMHSNALRRASSNVVQRQPPVADKYKYM